MILPVRDTTAVASDVGVMSDMHDIGTLRVKRGENGILHSN